MTKETKCERYLVTRAKTNQPVTNISFHLPVFTLTKITSTYVTLLHRISRHPYYTIQHFLSNSNVLHKYDALETLLTYSY